MASEAKPAGQIPTEVRSAQTFDGARLEYEVAGSGPPLVMLHGLLASRRTFSRQLAAFSEQFRLIMLSARGHDGSEMKLPPNYGVGSSDMDDLCTVLEARISIVYVW
jgi:pimeloyl-ACP methyl ester carboxylesterase